MANSGGDNLSFASSITDSDEGEILPVEIVVQSPVVPRPSYTKNELDRLLSFVKKMTVLYSLSCQDWSNAIDEMIKLWLFDVSKLTLYIFYDGNTLAACYELPLAPVHAIVYFLREPGQTFTVQDFHDEIIYGTITQDIDGTVLNVLEKIFGPIFFKYNEWTKNVKSHLCSALHKFVGHLNSLHYKLSGMTMLYVPSEGYDIMETNAWDDGEMIKRLEAVAVYWGSQIRMCLADREELVPYDVLCPFDEFDFWRYRYDMLQGLHAQLKQKDFEHLIEVLLKAQSVYIKQIFELSQDCKQEMDKAESNIEYLKLIVSPCLNLDDSTSSTDINKHVVNINHLYRFICLNSKFYNTREYITGLFRALSNQIIIFCRHKIDVKAVLQNKPRHGIKMCKMSIDCCLSYEAIFEIMLDNGNDRPPEKQLPLDRPLIFNHVNAFIKRLYDLIDICEAMIVFGRIDEYAEITNPKFGGIKGEQFEKTADVVQKTFLIGLNALRSNSSNVILNVHDSQWYLNLRHHKKFLQDVKEMSENLISHVFFNKFNVEDGIEALSSLFFFSCCKGIRRSYIKQVSHAWGMLLEEIRASNYNVLEQTTEKLCWIPQHAFKAVLMETNKDRMTNLKRKFTHCVWLPKLKDTYAILQQLGKSHDDFSRNKERLYEKWIGAANNKEPVQLLERMLMSRTHKRFLWCNIDNEIIRLCEEAWYFEIFGFKTPANINRVYCKYKIIYFIYQSILNITSEYNKIINALSVEEQKLFHCLIKSCDKIIAPGVTTLTWSECIQTTTNLRWKLIDDCIEATMFLQRFLRLYKETNAGIADVCEKICDTLILTLDVNTIVELSFLREKTEQYLRSVEKRFIKYYKEIVKLIAAVKQGFESHMKTEEMSEAWMQYICRFDHMIEESLIHSSRASLRDIIVTLHGDGSKGPSPILSISAILKRKEILFEPEIKHILEFFYTTFKLSLKIIELLPRLHEHFCVPEREMPVSYKSVIENDADWNFLQESILKEIYHTERELANYRQNWLPFKSIWEVDKEVFMREYEKKDSNAEVLESNIRRYTEISSQLALQETSTVVHFIVVNSHDMKNSILMHVNEWQKKHLELLAKKAFEKITNIYKYMETNTNLVQAVPRTVSAMQDSLINYRKLQMEIPQIESGFPMIIDFFKSLDKYEVKVPDEKKQLATNLFAEWQSYLNNLKDAEDMLGNSKDELELNRLNRVEKCKQNQM